MSRFTSLAVVAATALSAGVISSANAALLTYEGFTGYAANSDVVGKTGGSGFGAAWASPNSDGFLRTTRTAGGVISYSGYTGATTPAASGGSYLNLAAAFGGSNPTSVFRALDTSAGGPYGTNGYLSGGLIGADNKTLWASVLYSNERIGSGNQSFSTLLIDGTTYSQTLAQPQTTNLVVLRFDFGVGATDTITTFTNPNLATFDGTTGGVTSAAGNYAFNTLRLRQTYQNGPGGSGAETQYDDIRFGTTLADVAPVAVPEPASIGLIGIATVGLLSRRRRHA